MAVDAVVGRHVGDRRAGRAGHSRARFGHRADDGIDRHRDGRRCAMRLCRSRFRTGAVAATGDSSRVADARARCRRRGRHGDGKAQGVARRCRRQHDVRGTGDQLSVGRTAGGQGADGQVRRDGVPDDDGATAGGCARIGDSQVVGGLRANRQRAWRCQRLGHVQYRHSGISHCTNSHIPCRQRHCIT